MKISVCLASYNGEKYIEKQIESILNQKFSRYKDINIELIISDNGSTDNTKRIINSIKDARIMLLHNPDRNYRFYNSLIRATKNFENAIKESTGEFVFLSDQDDIWYPHKIETMLENFRNKQVCICSFDWMDQNEVFLGRTKYTSDVPKFISLVKRFPYYGFCFAFRQEFKENILPIPIVPQHDLFIGYIAKIQNNISICEEVLCSHRKFISDTKQRNVSDSSSNEPQLIRLYYRIKLVIMALYRCKI